MTRCDPCSCEYGCCALRIRFVVVVLLSLGIIVAYCHRASFSMAVIKMSSVSKKNASSQACPQYAKVAATISEVEGDKKKWNEEIQSWLQSMFFPGYVLSNLVAGFIADKWGARYPLLIGIGISTMVTFLTPTMLMDMDWKVIAGSRFITGLGQGMLIPSVTSCMQRWIPQTERSTFAGIVYASNAWGIMFGNTLTGYIIGQYKSWRTVFIFWATVSTIWLSFAFMYLFSYPESHPFLPRAEEQLLQDEITKRSEKLIPFKEIFSSRRVWAFVIGHISFDMVMFTMAANFFKYLINVLNYSPKELNLLSLIPGSMWVGTLLFGLLSDWLLKMNVNVTLVRKMMAFSGSFFPFVFLMAGTYSNCNRTQAVIFFSLAWFFRGPLFGSIVVNAMDLTSKYAGFLIAFSNGIGSIAGFFSPKIVGWLVRENTLEQWQNFMWGFNMLQLLLSIIFCCYASAERERWDYEPEELKYLPPKLKTKWYLQLPPKMYEENQFRRMEAARQRMA